MAGSPRSAMARRSLRVATYLRCTLMTRPEYDLCRRSQILRIYWALSSHACAASSRDGATAAFLIGRRSKLRTGTHINFHAKDGAVNRVVYSFSALVFFLLFIQSSSRVVSGVYRVHGLSCRVWHLKFRVYNPAYRIPYARMMG
jgi:hypothetical protein